MASVGGFADEEAQQERADAARRDPIKHGMMLPIRARDDPAQRGGDQPVARLKGPHRFDE